MMISSVSCKALVLTAVLLIACAISSAYAQDKTQPESGPAFEKERGSGSEGHKRMSPEERFKKDDTNGDGLLSKDEMLSSHKARIDQIFERLDTDKDSQLSPEEMKKGRESFREKMKERREKMKERRENGPGGLEGLQ